MQLVAPPSTEWTARPARRYGWPMRRSVYDPLEPTTEPRWYVVRSMHRAVIEAHRLQPDADLKRALVAAMLEHIDAGWHLDEFSSRTGHFFCTKDDERRMVEISPSDPGTWPRV
jgi:hypothetical protein